MVNGPLTMLFVPPTFRRVPVTPAMVCPPSASVAPVRHAICRPGSVCPTSNHAIRYWFRRYTRPSAACARCRQRVEADSPHPGGAAWYVAAFSLMFLIRCCRQVGSAEPRCHPHLPVPQEPESVPICHHVHTRSTTIMQMSHQLSYTMSNEFNWEPTMNLIIRVWGSVERLWSVTCP